MAKGTGGKVKGSPGKNVDGKGGGAKASPGKDVDNAPTKDGSKTGMKGGKGGKGGRPF